jgi:hypothetical protein
MSVLHLPKESHVLATLLLISDFVFEFHHKPNMLTPESLIHALDNDTSPVTMTRRQ